MGGPLTFRLILQPLVATIFAVRAGLNDARAGRPLYFWSIFTDPANRWNILHEGWKDVAKLFIVAVLIDCVYQVIALRWIYPEEALIVAAILAFVPYLLIRGLVNRIARRRFRSVLHRQ
jgi:hypothetical protein